MRRLRRLAPGLAMLAQYDGSWFPRDLLAGFSVAAVAVPIAIAYSALAGVPAVNGLYASLLPLVAYAIFGTSPQLILAPDAATCAVVATIVAPLAAGDLGRIISLTMTLTIITGVFCIIAGMARLGFLTNFLARPILTGYLNGIALSIISGQLGKLFGFPLHPAGFFRMLFEWATHLRQTHTLTLATGLAIFILLRLCKHLTPKIPAPLIAVALGITASSLFALGSRGVVLLGRIPPGLPHWLMPQLVAGDWWPLIVGAMGLALISFNSGMVTAHGFAVKNHYEIDSNQEFIALGVADLGAGLLQGFAVSGADSRTAVNDSVGGKSQVTGLVAAGLLVLVLLFLTGPLALLPITVLAAVLIHAALSLFDVEKLVELRRVSPAEYRLSIIASLGVMTLGVLPGVGVAVGMALLQILAKATRPHDAVLGKIPGMDGFHNIANYPDAETYPELTLYRFDSALLFFNADFFKSRVRVLMRQANPEGHCFLLDAESMPLLDTTGAATLEEVIAELSRNGITFALANARRGSRGILDRSGVMAKIGPGHIFPTLESAVAALRKNKGGSR